MEFEKQKSEKPINNDIYDQLGDRWYEADDDPVALLRASAKHKIPWIRSQVKALGIERPKILDVGCGGGFVSNALAKFEMQVTGIDASEDSLRIARKHDVTGNVQYVFADARKLPFENSSFDIVCAMDFLEHVQELDLVISEMHRVLKPGGVFLFHTFNRNFLAWLIAIKTVEWFVPNTPKDMHVLHMFIKPKELKLICERNGFTDLQFNGVKPSSIATILKGIWQRKVPREFDFEYTSSQLISYVGSARKT